MMIERAGKSLIKASASLADALPAQSHQGQVMCLVEKEPWRRRSCRAGDRIEHGFCIRRGFVLEAPGGGYGHINNEVGHV